MKRLKRKRDDGLKKENIKKIQQGRTKIKTTDKPKQTCEECQECGEIYFDEEQAVELAKKIDKEKQLKH